MQDWIMAQTAVIADLEPAVVTAVGEDQVAILLADGTRDAVLWENGINHASPYRTESLVGRRPSNPAEVLAPGDLIRVTRNPEETGT